MWKCGGRGSKKVLDSDVNPDSVLLIYGNVERQVCERDSSFLVGERVNCLVEHYCRADDGGVRQGLVEAKPH